MFLLRGCDQKLGFSLFIVDLVLIWFCFVVGGVGLMLGRFLVSVLEFTVFGLVLR